MTKDITTTSVTLELTDLELHGLDEIRKNRSREDFIKMYLNLIIEKRQQKISPERLGAPLPFFSMNETGEIKEFS